MATTKAPKQEQAIIDRQQYIKRAKITFKGDYARVTSQSDKNRDYPVRIVNGKAYRCECDDYFYRQRKVNGSCKHMEAVDLRIEKDAARAAKKAAKAAKSAEIVASLQVADGTKVRKVRGQNQLVARPVQQEAPVVDEPEVVAVAAPAHVVENPIEVPTLVQTPRIEHKPQFEPYKPVPSGVVRGNLHSSRAFQLMA